MKNKELFFYLIFTILCMLLIFTFSSKSSHLSNGTSKKLIDKGITLYEYVSNKKVNHDQVIQKLNYPVRKVAHYSIYFLLGIFVYHFIFYSRCKFKVITSIGICLLYAILDEFHQLFVMGRTGQVLDVFIDTMGSVTAIFLLMFIKKRRDVSNVKKVAQE